MTKEEEHEERAAKENLVHEQGTTSIRRACGGSARVRLEAVTCRYD